MKKRLAILIFGPFGPTTGNPASPLDPLNSVSRGVNLLSLYISILTVIGCFAVYFQTHTMRPIAFAGAGIVAFYFVATLNYLKQYESANVLFYLAVNTLTLPINPYMEEPGQTMLAYFFLLSLIVFLFETLPTRVICMGIIISRIILFEINFEFIVHQSLSSDQQAWLWWVVNGVLLSLIILVFVLYAVKLVRAEDINKKNSHFFQHMSHDLQIAYFSVASICAHLKNSMDAKSTLKNEPALVNELMNATGYCSYILNNFLEYSKFEKGTLYDNHYESIDLGSEIGKIVDLHKFIADQKGIRIAVDIDETLPELITSDRIKINRIFLNLLSNAVKNTPPGRGIFVKIEPDKDQWKLSVTNEGEGLNADEVQDLFLPYPARGTADKQRKFGLGLPITKDLVEALGGRIFATSRLNKETMFTVAIPFI